MRILIVEDETKLAAFLKKGLVQEGFAADVTRSAAEAVDRTEAGSYAVVILDINLPDRDGFSVLKQLRDTGDTTPVLMLTARDSIHDKVRGLESGANDYLTKPFAFRELLARVRVLLRSRSDPKDVLTVGDLSLDLAARRVVRAGRLLRLTNKELALLELLMRHVGRPVSRVLLWEHAWEGSFEVNSNVLDVHMGRLRRKIDAAGKIPLIETVYGIGYKMERPA